MNFFIRVIATAALWSIALFVALRLRHPMVGLAVAAAAGLLSFLIWSSRSQPGGR